MTCPGTPRDLDAGVAESYLWHDGFTGQMYQAIDSGFYWVEVVDSLGCVGSDTFHLIYECPFDPKVPSVFTPNADGINDFFEISGDGIESAEISVFNRWGIEVFAGTGTDSWDGRNFTGVAQPAGTYFYIVTVEALDKDREPLEFKGALTLLR